MGLKEAEFLVEMFAAVETLDIAGFYANYITTFPSEAQTVIVASLRKYNISAVTSLRTQSDASDTELTRIRSDLNVARRILVIAIRDLEPESALIPLQMNINAWHITIALWQMIYSR